MARKTVNVDELKTRVNDMLANSTCSAEMRYGMCNVIELALMETGNYKGFGYLTAEMLGPDVNGLPGIHIDENGNVRRDLATDDSRRQYF
jgi:hypothetical protein